MPDFTDNLKPAEPSGHRALSDARARSSLPVEDLSRHLLSKDGFLERQARVLKALNRERLFSKATQLNLSRPDRYKLGLARAKLLRRMADRLHWSHQDHHMAEYLVDDVSPYLLHMTMFVTTIREQGSEEQREYWLPLIESWKIYGAYAQTELGHGSNVRGIELEARWDPQSREFILHSPTLTASKWWNGSLGRTATHAIVVAQLLLPEDAAAKTLKYKSHGPKPFIVQVRDQKTHQPLPGIAVGDIGPKYGYPSMDNAYMLFNQFRVPHSAFLSRYFQVDPETSRYSTKARNQAVVYGSLTNVRVNIIMHARLVLARAVTIAVRYLTIRRQFRNRDAKSAEELEMSVLDYPTVQIRILPLLASTFALHYTGLAMGSQYAATRESIESGDFSKMADLHASSSGLKSLCTTLAADGIEVCRRACGGHGFGGGSGLIPLNNDYLSKPTVEGDNWMITQQTASYIIKKVGVVSERHRDFIASSDRLEQSTASYLQAKENRKPSVETCLPILEDDAAIVSAFERRTSHLALKAHRAREVEKKSWNSLLIQLHHLSNAYSQAILVRNFYNALTQSSTSVPSSARPILQICFRLFSVQTMNNFARDFSSACAVSEEDLDALPSVILKLMGGLKPHAVSLVDAWAIPDYLLDSALGRSDGKVYEDLFNRAHRLNPLNRETFNPYYWQEEIVMGSGDRGKQVLSKL